jgi:hypothetical protein
VSSFLGFQKVDDTFTIAKRHATPTPLRGLFGMRDSRTAFVNVDMSRRRREGGVRAVVRNVSGRSLRLKYMSS